MKIVVGGQIDKQEIHDFIKKYFGEGMESYFQAIKELVREV